MIGTLAVLAWSAQDPMVAIARVETAEPVVALTFDACATAGQDNGFDRPVFDILKAEHVPATVFVSGRWLKTHPEAARDLAAAEFIEFGNHSYAHPRLPRMSPARVAREIDDTERLIEALGRHSVALRPPFGDWNARLVKMAADRSLPTVLWDVVSGDAGGHVAADTMVRTVAAEVRPGSIVIFHINERGPFTKDALPTIIARLRARGLRFVFVSDLLRLPDARIIPARASTRVPPKEPRARSAG